ncbi:MAG: hypothetical protein A3A82_00810 [Candidatus Pacebacteria bacterium RIFCSPLOWO2_01_FULL_47_12]|nr:MAG: hypothetical protein A3A82_00810 [Candidatus Pacebacteria bacterium RIFCSPLOWO2_01_FULL_47_12]
MENKTKIIWTAGQLTALVLQDEINTSKKLAIRLLKQYPAVDQVGFVSKKTATLTMMGGELSINGCIAAGYTLGRSKQKQQLLLSTSCVGEPIKIRLAESVVSASFPRTLITSQTKNEVCLQGVRYQLIAGFPDSQTLTIEQRSTLTQMLSYDFAAGFIFYEGDRIIPVVAVAGTKTLYWEQACGSGSLAYWAISGCSNVLQPSGEYLLIIPDSQYITISATTKEILI